MGPTLQKRLILNVANQPKSADMPQKHSQSLGSIPIFALSTSVCTIQKLAKKLYIETGFLIISANTLFSATFACFFGKRNKEKGFARTGLSNWKDAHKMLAKHEKSQYQIDCTGDFINFFLHTNMYHKAIVKAS